jgi:hypothetical protein
MDPYSEAQGNRQDFHNRLIANICDALGTKLPEDHVARVDERVEVIGGEEDGHSYRPDFLVAARPSTGPGGAASTAVDDAIEPTLNEVSDRDPYKVRHTWLEVRRLPEMDRVTVIEVPSPVNKGWPGRPACLAKRDDLHARRVHFVEIDLLLAGPTLPMKRPPQPVRYHAIVARRKRLPTAETCTCSVRNAHPKVPIPLRILDPDVPIELGPLVERVYTQGRYARTRCYDRPLPEAMPLAPEDREWVGAVVRSARGGKPQTADTAGPSSSRPLSE